MRGLNGAALATVVEEIFTTMVDDGPGAVAHWSGNPAAFTRPVHAWVDISGTYAVRTVLTTETATAGLMARALAGMGSEERVDEADLVDAVGEVANMISGNIKPLACPDGVLGLPEVARTAPAGRPWLRSELRWRGAPLVISVLMPLGTG